MCKKTLISEPGWYCCAIHQCDKCYGFYCNVCRKPLLDSQIVIDKFNITVRPNKIPWSPMSKKMEGDIVKYLFSVALDKSQKCYYLTCDSFDFTEQYYKYKYKDVCLKCMETTE